MINEENENEFKYYFEKINYFQREIKIENIEELIYKIKQKLNVQILDSNCCGFGKTNLIKNYSVKHNFNLITFPFGYTDSIEKILEDLKTLNFKEKKNLFHLNIYDTKYINALQEFIFYLIFTKFGYAFL